MIFREKLVNASTGEVRQGNVLDSSLGEVEQIMIDSSLCSVMYYWVKTPDSTWRKTQYYELVENLYSIIYKVNDAIYQTYYLQEGDDVPVPSYTPATGYSWSGWLNENIPAKMPASDIVVESYTEQTDYAIIYYIDGRVVYSETHHYNDSITAYVPETREHYVFSGWSGFPQSGLMPAENVTVTGTYEEDLSYVLSYYVDASVYTQQSYMSNDAVMAPDDPQVEEGYSWSGWIDLPSLMPAYDSSVHSVLTANQYILDYYVDSSLWNSLIYNYKQNIVHQTYTPAEGYIFSGWVNEPETMPAINHYRVDGMTQLMLYNVYWYIDSSLIQTAQYESGTTVISPVCEDSAYVYDWNGYDTFTMPSADTSIYGEKIAKSEPVITYTVSWYIDSSLIQTAQYAPGTTVTSPVCQDPDYVYDWGEYDTFTMASADVTVTGEKIAKSEPIDPSIYIDSSLFGISLEQYKDTVSTPVVTFGYTDRPNGARGGVYYQLNNAMNYLSGAILPIRLILSDGVYMWRKLALLEAVFGFQISSDGITWTDAIDIQFSTNVQDKTVDANGIVHMPEFASSKYVRLVLKSITGEIDESQKDMILYYGIIIGRSDRFKYMGAEPKCVVVADNTQEGCKYQVFGKYDTFYSLLQKQINNYFNTDDIPVHGLTFSIANNVCHAHNAYENTAHNYIISGYKYHDGWEYVTIDSSTCCIETAPVNQATDVYTMCYAARWKDSKSLVTAPALPATDITEATLCYTNMFEKCESLINPPALPAQVLSGGCYSYMFAWCKSLQTTPDLEAEILSDDCYNGMFRGCYELRTISELPALTVPNGAYKTMFSDCYHLLLPPVIRANVFGEYACQWMFSNCHDLTSRAELSVVDASANAFDQMYYGCTSLED